MQVVRLPVGQPAPLDADCLRIEQTADGLYALTASALCAEADEGESVAIVDAPLFENVAKAEAAGLVWAANVGVERLFISIGTLAEPLKLTEIDKPL